MSYGVSFTAKRNVIATDVATNKKKSKRADGDLDPMKRKENTTAPIDHGSTHVVCKHDVISVAGESELDKCNCVMQIVRIRTN